MKTIQTFFFIWLFCCARLPLGAQVFVVDSYYFTIDDIEDKTIDELIESVKQTIIQYDSYAKLLDEDTRTVTQRALNRFKNLFEFNARIYDDLSGSSYEMNYSDYASRVLEHLEEEGVNFDMYGALIDQISYDSAGYYNVDVITEKYVYNGLEDNNKPFYCRKGRIFRLKFTFTLPEKDIKNARITKITGILAKDCEDRVPVFFIQGQYRKGFGQVDLSDFYRENMSGLNWDKPDIWAISVGASVQYPLDKTDGFFLTGGIHYHSWKLSQTLNGAYTFRTEDHEGVPIDKLVQLSNAIEEAQFELLNVPIGIKYKWLDQDPIYAFVDVAFSFNFPIQQSGDFTADANYSAVYDDGTIEFLNFQNGLVVPDEYKISTTHEPKLFYDLRISPSFQYVLGQNMALEFGIDYSFGLSEWFDKQPSEVFLLGNDADDFDRNLFESFTDRFSVNSIGFRIGFIYKKRW